MIKKDTVRKGQIILALSNPNPEIEPNPLDKNLHKTVARAVARVAVEQGLNRDDLTGYFD